MALQFIRYVDRPANRNGTPLMVVSPYASVHITYTTPDTVVWTLADGTTLQSVYGYDPNFPLLLKLFFSGVMASPTQSNFEYVVKVTGPFPDYYIHRSDVSNFGTTHTISVPNWNIASALSVAVTVYGVSESNLRVAFDCVAGLATDNIDRITI